MSKITSDDRYSEAEIVVRRDPAIKRMLNTLPKPHSEMKIGKSKGKLKKKPAKSTRKE